MSGILTEEMVEKAAQAYAGNEVDAEPYCEAMRAALEAVLPLLGEKCWRKAMSEPELDS